MISKPLPSSVYVYATPSSVFRLLCKCTSFGPPSIFGIIPRLMRTCYHRLVHTTRASILISRMLQLQRRKFYMAKRAMERRA
jgi:hypothetical protein